NVREPGRHVADPRSRGQLVAECLRAPGGDAPAELVARVEGVRYEGFNLLVGDRTGLGYVTNREPGPRALGPGVYAVSNHRLDTAWPKVSRGRLVFEEVLRGARAEWVSRLMGMLTDGAQAPDELLLETGVGLERERLLSPIFVNIPDVG